MLHVRDRQPIPTFFIVFACKQRIRIKKKKNGQKLHVKSKGITKHVEHNQVVHICTGLFLMR